MKNNEEFEQVILDFPEAVKEIARAARGLIYRVLPDVAEVIWRKQKNIGFGTGPKKNTEHFCWMMPATKHVTLGFNYGAELPDPGKILEGTGKLFRHYKVKSVEDLSNPHLIKMLKFAITYKVPSIKNNDKT